MDEGVVGAVVRADHIQRANAAEVVFRRCHALRVPVRELGRGDVWERRDLRVEVLHPRRYAAGPAARSFCTSV